MKQFTELKQGKNYTAKEIGPLDRIHEFTHYHSQIKRDITGKLFCGEELHSSGAEISFQSAPPGYTIPFDHAHQKQEEIYLILSGKGFFVIDGEEFPVSEGSIVRIGCKGVRRWGNSGDDNFTFLCIQATEKSLISHETLDGYLVV